jgi:hypothetical protein
MTHTTAADEVMVAMSCMGESVLAHLLSEQCRKSYEIGGTCDLIQESSALRCGAGETTGNDPVFLCCQ